MRAPDHRVRPVARSRGAVMAGALALDAALGEPGGRWHPVVLLGRMLELAYAPWSKRRPVVQLAGGGVALALVVSISAVAARCVEGGLRRTGPLAPVLTAIGLKPTFAVRQLLVEGWRVGADLDRDDLGRARERLRALVSRPTADLTEPLVASAAIESLAENLADSVTAPLLAYACFGLAGAAVYRSVNTADAMVGYRGEWEWLGKVAARADDVLSWVPSRLSALAIAAAVGLLRGPSAATAALGSGHREGGVTASPNAGRPMAAMAGALGVRLEKPGAHVLGAGRRDPDPADVRAAVAVTGIAAALVAALAISAAGAFAGLARVFR